MASLGQEAGPPDLVLKLAFQFLEWEDIYRIPHKSQILNKVDLVCKHWKRILYYEDSDVGRQLCINQIKSYDAIMAMRNKNGRANAEMNGTEFTEKVWFNSGHELLVRMMSAPPVEGRACKDMFILSKRIGALLTEHKLAGPDKRWVMREGGRSLRESCMYDYRWIVAPTIERLKRLFDDPKEREQEILQMKSRLLNYARSHGRSSVIREDPTRMEKEALEEIAGNYFMMLAVSNSLDEDIFNTSSSSGLSATLGEIINGFESLTGKEMAAHLSVQLKRTASGVEKEFTFLPSSKKRLKESLRELEWPMSPVDCLSFLIRQSWPEKWQVEYGNFSDGELNASEKEKIWNDVVVKWWLDLPEPIRQLFLTIHTQLANRFDDVAALPADIKSTEVPVDVVKFLLDLKYDHSRGKVAELFWHGLDPKLREEMFKIYHQQANSYSDAIQQEYHAVYNNAVSLEQNAKILLDIFLEVSYDDDQGYTLLPQLTSENCDEFLARMEATMNRWNELVEQIKSDDDVLWNPETITELMSFQPMWGHREWRRKRRKKNKPVHSNTAFQFVVPRMVAAFMHQRLDTKRKLPMFYSFQDDAKKFTREYTGKNFYQFSNAECADWTNRSTKILHEFRALSTYVNAKEHAMMALIPLLPKLSQFDAKRLVYAIFIERHNDHDVWSCLTDGFSKSDMNFGSLWTYNMPCALGDYVETAPSLENESDRSLFGSDLSQVTMWATSHDFKGFDGRSTLNRIFGLPLPANIISAMGEYMVENLYQGSINDVDSKKMLNAFGVRPFLERYCYENPENSQIVWSHLQQAIENAILVVEGLEAGDVDERQRETFNKVVTRIVICCINTRAKCLVPLLRRLEDTQALMPELIADVGNLVNEMEENPPVLVDTRSYYELFQESQL